MTLPGHSYSLTLPCFPPLFSGLMTWPLSPPHPVLTCNFVFKVGARTHRCSVPGLCLPVLATGESPNSFHGDKPPRYTRPPPATRSLIGHPVPVVAVSQRLPQPDSRKSQSTLPISMILPVFLAAFPLEKGRLISARG